MYFLRDVLIPVALAILVTFLLTPVVNRLERWRLGRVGSVLAVVVAVFGLFAVLGWVTAGQVLQLGEQLPQYQDDIVAKIQQLRPGKGGTFDKIANTAAEVQQRIADPSTQPASQPADVIATEIARQTDTSLTRSAESVERQEQAGAPPTTQWTRNNPLPVGVVEPKPSPLETVGQYLGVILGPLGTAGLVIVFVLFMLLQREDLRDRLIRLVGHGSGQLQLTTSALDDASNRISRYLLAQAIVNGTYGAAVAIGLWIIGATMGHPERGDPETFPSFILWGLLCALLRFVPYIGPWIAATFPMLVAFAVYKGFGVFLTTAAMFVVIELLSNNVMEPYLYGSSTGMSAVAVLVSAVFWTFLWGPVGLLLATPMTVCLVVLGKYVPQLQFLDILLGDEPVLDPHQRIYQRLLALDEEEATETAGEYLKEMTLERVYDTVLMPALALAEQDRHRGRLDEQRQAFVRRVMRQLVEELADRQREMDAGERAEQIRAEADAVVSEARGLTPSAAPAQPVAGATAAAAPNGNGNSSLLAKIAGVGSGAIAKAAETVTGGPNAAAVVPVATRTRLPQGCTINVVLLPAHDEADEIVGNMLAQLLELQGFCAFPISVEALASEMVDAVGQKAAHVVCISAMPPAAVTHSRYLCKRVHARFKTMNMVVGLWTYRGDLARARERITCEQSVSVHTTLADAIDRIEQLSAPLTLPSGQAPTDTPATKASEEPVARS